MANTISIIILSVALLILAWAVNRVSRYVNERINQLNDDIEELKADIESVEWREGKLHGDKAKRIAALENYLGVSLKVIGQDGPEYKYVKDKEKKNASKK